MLPYRSPLKLRACHAACNSVVILTAAYSVFFAASLRFVALARLCRNCLIESGLLQLGSAHCTSFSRKKSTGCQCFCSPAGRCGTVMLFAPTPVPNTQVIAYTRPTLKRQKITPALV